MKPTTWLSRLRVRALLLVVLTSLPVTGVVVWNGLVLHEQVRNDTASTVRHTARIAANHLEVLLDGVRQMLGVVAQELERTGQDWQAGERVLAPFLAAFPQFVNLMIADPDGRIVASGVPLKAPITLDDRAYWREMKTAGAFTISDLVVSRSTGKPTLVCAQPVSDVQGRPLSVLIASLDPRCFSQLSVRLGLGADTLLTVLDTRGTVIFRNQDAGQWVGQIADEPHVRTFFAGRQQPLDWTGPGVDGLRRLLSLVPVRLPSGTRSMAVAVGVPETQAFAAASEHQWRTLTFTVLVVAAAMLLAWFGTELVMLRPLRILLTAIRSVARGDLSVRTGLGDRPGELGELARHVDDMATALAAREEARVRAEQALRLDEQRLEALLHLSRLDNADEAAIAAYTLQAAIALTGARFGWLAHIADDGRMEPFAWLPDDRNGPVAGRGSVRLAECGRLGEALTAGRPDIVNDMREATPAIRILLPATTCRFCATALAKPGLPRLAACVSDKGRNFDDADTRQLALLLDEMGRLLGRRREAETRNRLEDELDQVRKLESLGRLAGGVAHDFNNLLTSVIGYADLARRRSDDPAFVRDAASRIETAASQATALTEQLLGFARKGKRSSVPVDVHRCIEQVLGIAEHTLGHGITVTRRFEAGHPTILGDPSQITQVLLNLAINARDAMSGGGLLTIATGTVILDRDGERASDAKAGEYLIITVEDTGTGIAPEVLPHLFEPFFTTKPRGRGTGLGLATCHGIVHNHGGFITVDSHLGRGTRFAIHLPLRRDLAPEAQKVPTPALVRGKGRVLVVDDEACVRGILADLLAALGYEAVVAEDGPRAEILVMGDSADLSLAVVDLNMPGMDGPACAARLHALRPGLPIVFSSGHVPDDHLQEAIATGRYGFIQKPYRLADVAAAISQMLTGHRE